MKSTADMFLLMRGMGKVHEAALEKPRREYSLSQIEVKIISFLSNNPDKDTAAEISYIRMLPKGNVSQAIDALIKKGLVKKRADEKDKRKYHLYLTENSFEIVDTIKNVNEGFLQTIYKGLSNEEMETYMSINEKIFNNVLQELEGKNERQ